VIVQFERGPRSARSAAAGVVARRRLTYKRARTVRDCGAALPWREFDARALEPRQLAAEARSAGPCLPGSIGACRRRDQARDVSRY
jgi:hypothetical protein